MSDLTLRRSGAALAGVVGLLSLVLEAALLAISIRPLQRLDARRRAVTPAAAG